MAQQLTREIIEAAIEGLTAKQDAIGRQIAELRAMSPGVSSGRDATSQANRATSSKRRGSKRVLSAEARERISAAQRARWAAARGEAPSSAPAPAKAPKKRRLSPEGRRNIQEALRERWAQKR